MMFYKSVLVITFDNVEANGLIYDVNLAESIAHGLYEYRNKISYAINSDPETITKTPYLRIVNIYGDMFRDEVVGLFVDIEVDDNAPSELKELLSKQWRIAIQTEDDVIEGNIIKSCKLNGIIVDFLGK